MEIARELHDVVAHSLSVIAVQSGVGRHVIDEHPAQAKRALSVVEETSRTALDELRRMLSVLRHDDHAARDVVGDAGRGGPRSARAKGPRRRGGRRAERSYHSGVEPLLHGRSRRLSHRARGPDERGQARGTRFGAASNYATSLTRSCSK